MAYVGPQFGVAPAPSVRASQSGAPSWLETATYTVFEFSGIPLRLHGAHCPGLCSVQGGVGFLQRVLIVLCPPHARVHAASFLIFLGVKTFIGACVSRERRARDRENADTRRAASSRRHRLLNVREPTPFPSFIQLQASRISASRLRG